MTGREGVAIRYVEKLAGGLFHLGDHETLTTP
jgi:hypothetical protein